MFLRFLFFFSFASVFAQNPVTLCEEKWDNGTTKCGPVFYSGADLLSDNLYVSRRFDIARVDSLVYDLGNLNYQDLDSLVLEMDFNATSIAMTPYYDTLSNGFQLDQEIGSVFYYKNFSANTNISCRWNVKFTGQIRLLKNGRLSVTFSSGQLGKKLTFMYFSLDRTFGLMKLYDADKFRTTYISCPNGKTERQLYNCFCEKTLDPASCKLAFFTPSGPYSYNLTMDNFVSTGYKSGTITSIGEQNDGQIATKQVIARYDLMGRLIEENATNAGVLILVFSDGTRQKVFVE